MARGTTRPRTANPRDYAQTRLTSSAIAAETVPRDFGISSTTIAPTAGVVHLRRIYLTPGSYTTITYAIGGQQGSVLTNSFFSVFTADGATQMGVSADVSASLAAVLTFANGTATCNSTITTAGDYWIALLVGSASTMPQFAGGSQSSSSPFSLTPLLIAKSGTGQTAMPSSVTPAAPSTASNFWFRYS